jgi:hypothetical protein
VCADDSIVGGVHMQTTVGALGEERGCAEPQSLQASGAPVAGRARAGARAAQGDKAGHGRGWGRDALGKRTHAAARAALGLRWGAGPLKQARVGRGEGCAARWATLLRLRGWAEGRGAQHAGPGWPRLRGGEGELGRRKKERELGRRGEEKKWS